MYPVHAYTLDKLVQQLGSLKSVHKYLLIDYQRFLHARESGSDLIDSQELDRRIAQSQEMLGRLEQEKISLIQRIERQKLQESVDYHAEHLQSAQNILHQNKLL